MFYMMKLVTVDAKDKNKCIHTASQRFVISLRKLMVTIMNLKKSGKAIGKISASMNNVQHCIMSTRRSYTMLKCNPYLLEVVTDISSDT